MFSRFSPPVVDVLPCVQFFYRVGKILLDYAESEKDLGIIMTRTQNFTEHANSLYNCANQHLGLLKRSCRFVESIPKRRLLYLTLVRSIFEHCPVVWRPSSESPIDKLESFQKWINKEIGFVLCKL